MRGVAAWCGWVALCLSVEAAAALATSPGAWYAALAKPAWTPPPWLFGPVWTLLYLLMAHAAWLIGRERDRPGRGLALAAFVAQLAVNGAWSFLFFRWHHIGAALADLAVLWLLLVVTIVLFARRSSWAAWLLAPYLAWTTYALALNTAIWQMN